MELAAITKSEAIRRKLALFKAKATDQRHHHTNALKRIKDPALKELCEFNIGVLDRHIDRCSKLTRSKVLQDANPNNDMNQFTSMIIVGHFEGKQITFDVKNMERLRPMKKLELS